MPRFIPQLLCLSLLGSTACDPSDLKAWIEGNRDIPEAWDAFIPEAARKDLIDAEIKEGEVSLRYHEGDWASIVQSFQAPLEAAGYVKLGVCPSSDGEEEASVAYAKLVGDGNADVVNVGLSTYLKFNEHFFLSVKRAEFSTMFLPEGCSFTDDAASVCESLAGSCNFKSP